MAKQRIIPIVYKVDYSQVDKSTASVKKAEQATDKLNKEIKETGDVGGKSFAQLKNAILATGVIGVLGTVAKKIFDVGVASEQTTIAFNTFLGSASKARLLLADLTKFALVTPFSPDQVNSAAKALLAFGVQGKQVIPILKMLGDVSAGTGKDLTEMAVIFGQIKSTGRLMGQDLLQLINAGFNPLQVISEKTGKSMAVLKQEMEKGLISFQMVSDAFKTATSEGGLFFNLMEKQSVSIGGKLSTVAGNIEEVFKNIFSASSGPLSDFVDKLGVISEAFLMMSKSQDQWAQEMADIKLERFRTRLSEIEDQLKSNNKAIQENAVSLQNSFAIDVVNAINEIDAELRQLNKDFDNGLITHENAKRQSLALHAELRGLQEIKGELFNLKKGTDDVTESTVKLTKEQERARQKALDAISKMMGFTTASEKVTAKEEEAKKLEKIESDANDRSLKNQEYFYNLRNKKAQEQREYEWEQAEEAAQKRIEQEAELAAEIERLKRELADTLIAYGREVLVDALVGREEDFSSQEAYYDKQILLAGDNERAKKEIELKREADRQKFEKAQKERQKKEARARIGIDTAIAIIKTFAQFGWPAGIVPAALMAGIGVTQLALVGKYAEGVIDLQGPGTSKSDSIPAMLSKGESVMTAEETMNSNGILKAIRAKKLDDKQLEKLYKGKVGTDGVAFTDKRIVEAIKGQKQPDVVKIGSYLYDVRTKNRDHKQFVRRKYIS